MLYFVLGCRQTEYSIILIIQTFNFIVRTALIKEITTCLRVFCCSYMDTEQYEEAVRDYEKVYQTEKTKGESFSIVTELTQFSA